MIEHDIELDWVFVSEWKSPSIAVLLEMLVAQDADTFEVGSDHGGRMMQVLSLAYNSEMDGAVGVNVNVSMNGRKEDEVEGVVVDSNVLLVQEVRRLRLVRLIQPVQVDERVGRV
jgi:hypothetical protein